METYDPKDNIGKLNVTAWIEKHRQRYLKMPKPFRQSCDLTFREFLVIAGYGDGFNSDAIQYHLGMSQSTLARTKRNLCQKMYAENLVQAAVIMTKQWARDEK